MSTEYLSFKNIRTKIEGVIETNNDTNKLFGNKQKILDYSLCDNTKLEKYQNQDYVIDDDIIPGLLPKEILMTVEIEGYSNTDIDYIEITATSDIGNSIAKLTNSDVIKKINLTLKITVNNNINTFKYVRLSTVKIYINDTLNKTVSTVTSTINSNIVSINLTNINENSIVRITVGSAYFCDNSSFVEPYYRSSSITLTNVECLISSNIIEYNLFVDCNNLVLYEPVPEPDPVYYTLTITMDDGVDYVVVNDDTYSGGSRVYWSSDGIYVYKSTGTYLEGTTLNWYSVLLPGYDYLYAYGDNGSFIITSDNGLNIRTKSI